MPVQLRELEGFTFIYEPREFDAAFCAGRCPPRFSPRNDHALLQSLMHIKSKKEVTSSGFLIRILHFIFPGPSETRWFESTAKSEEPLLQPFSVRGKVLPGIEWHMLCRM